MIQAGYADIDVEVEVDVDVNVYWDVNVNFYVDIDVEVVWPKPPNDLCAFGDAAKTKNCQKCFKIVQLNLVLFNPEIDFLLKPLNVINPLNLFFLFFSPSHLYQH